MTEHEILEAIRGLGYLEEKTAQGLAKARKRRAAHDVSVHTRNLKALDIAVTALTEAMEAMEARTSLRLAEVVATFQQQNEAKTL